ncbi:Fanconi anemia core complex-associated protein 20 [Canis lupus familiaris]|uniref:Fanconi anemia core complex-associated protein 20 n=1 Tax=Canis lupus familiaris TaxID=9615 RepID=UPI0018F4CCA5|nr:Fanconi anemia core complex-associated protein 20 [Canis lupus familiaris]XP_038394742.1 Fanconi anemia core complex-associated protein 20 [Canis lupus familiaris]XP_038523445.1 Fanconi anemia core complex-associated protein 20 [Canis lupus familiaris]
MEAARRPRPSLRRRRPSPGAAAPGRPLGAAPSPPSPPSPAGRLLLSSLRALSGRGGPVPGVGECARPWADLLRAGIADLSPDGELPPLPAFPGPDPGRRPKRTASPEEFTVGARTFSWTPFPPAPRGGGGLGPPHRVPLRARSPQRCASPEPRGTPGAPEQLWEASPSLRSCPMCQVDFAPRLAQLDIDSHLAQCLAESTEDVVW